MVFKKKTPLLSYLQDPWIQRACTGCAQRTVNVVKLMCCLSTYRKWGLAQFHPTCVTLSFDQQWAAHSKPFLGFVCRRLAARSTRAKCPNAPQYDSGPAVPIVTNSALHTQVHPLQSCLQFYVLQAHCWFLWYAWLCRVLVQIYKQFFLPKPRFVQ